MRSVQALVATGAFVVAVGGVGLVDAPAAGASPGAAVARGPATVCVPVQAIGTGQDLGDGRTTATISVGRVVVGTTSATFTITGGSGSTVTFSGPIVFANSLGTVTASVTGTLNVTTGDFVSTSSMLTGTGAYTGVSGTLTFAGHEDLATGAFTETITGSLCLPRGGR